MNDQLDKTIRSYAASGNVDAIITLASSFQEQRDRAEMKVAAYLHEIKILAQRFSAITEPATGKLVIETGKSAARPEGQVRTEVKGKSNLPKKKSGPQAIDIDL